MITKLDITSMGCLPWTTKNLNDLNCRLEKRAKTKSELERIEDRFLDRMREGLRPR